MKLLTRHLLLSPSPLVLAIIVLNLADVVFSLFFLNIGVEEANPVMAWFFTKGPVAFTAFKLSIVGAGVVVIETVASPGTAYWVFRALVALFIGIVGLHLLGLRAVGIVG